MNTEEFEKGFKIGCEIIREEDKKEKMSQLQAKSPSELKVQEDYLKSQTIIINKLIEKMDYREKKDPATLVKELRTAGKNDCEIALVLLEGCKLSTFEIGTLLPARPSTTIDPESVSRRGRKLLEKGRKNTPQ